MKTILYSILLLGSVFVLGAFGGDDNSDYPSGAPAGYTGSPGDGHNCTSCHGGSQSTVSGWITSDIPADGYTPGTNYTITVTVSGSGQKGFEVSPQDGTGTLLGTLTAGTGNHLTGSGKYVTHSAKSSANPKTWSFTWTAPAAGTGLVTFYGAFCVSEPVTKLSTMDVSENTSAANLAVIATATPSLICNGQTSQLNANASGGSGNYSYSWTSLPPGYNSTISNPVVQPVQTTQYIVLVDDGVNSVSDTTEVAVNQLPNAFAGNDTTFNLYITQIQLQGVAANYSTVAWTTSGDGTFQNPAVLNAVYFPGTLDKTSRAVDLTLTATPLSPCSGNASSVIHILFDPNTGIDQQDKGRFSINVSPNPNQGIFTVFFNGGLEQKGQLLISDISGRTLIEEDLLFTSSMTKRMDIAGFPKGIYFLEVRSGSGIVTKKIILD
jgi:hypothetical protein